MSLPKIKICKKRFFRSGLLNLYYVEKRSKLFNRKASSIVYINK